jgi:hypothetical protein
MCIYLNSSLHLPFGYRSFDLNKFLQFPPFGFNFVTLVQTIFQHIIHTCEVFNTDMHMRASYIHTDFSTSHLEIRSLSFNIFARLLWGMCNILRNMWKPCFYRMLCPACASRGAWLCNFRYFQVNRSWILCSIIDNLPSELRACWRYLLLFNLLSMYAFAIFHIAM